MKHLMRVTLVLLLLVAVFDPADLITHMKVPLFVLACVILLVDLFIWEKEHYPVPGALLLYTLVFSLVLPLTSIFLYLLRDGRLSAYDGFTYLKSYLFLTLCIPLAIKRIGLVRPLSFVLTALSVLTLVIYAITFNDDALRAELWILGDKYGFVGFADRTYGSLSYPTVYFHTSPLLVIAIAYFCYRSLHSDGRTRLWNIFFLLLNMFAMLFSGTRNNMIASLLVPLAVTFWYARRRVKLLMLATLTLITSAIFNYGVVRDMFSVDDYSNTIKLLHLRDYMAMFSHWPTLLFGQGLGARFYSTAWGSNVSLTELTYLEFIRNFGLILAIVYFALLLYPLTKLKDPAFRECHHLILAYGSYLTICISNPLLVSSSGMLVLAIVLFKTFSPPAKPGHFLKEQSI